MDFSVTLLMTGSCVLVLLFCIYMVRRASLNEGQSKEKASNEEYNRMLQEKYMEVANRKVATASDILDRMRTDGENH